MATYTAYEVVGKAEDVSDIITNISPTTTPFQSMIGTESVHNVLFQWQEDALASVNTTNYNYDGFDASDATLSATTIRTNYTQILQKNIKVAATVDKIQRYGRAKETAYQLAKAGAELRRDLEYFLTNSQAGTGGQNAANSLLTSIGNPTGGSGGAAVPRKMAAFQSQLDTSTYGANLLVKTGGSSTAMSETNLTTALQQLFNNGVDPKFLMIPPGEALNIASYASATGRYRFADNSEAEAARRVVNVVDLYVSPFGEVKVILNRFQVNTDHLIFDPDMWKLVVLRPWTRTPLATVGDAERQMIVGEYSLKHKHWGASAIVRKSA